MLNRLPESVDPFRLAAQGVRLAGVVPLGQLERLRPLLHEAEGVAEAELEFATDSKGGVSVNGWITCDLTLACQRCGNPYVVHVDTRLQVGLVQSSDESTALPEDIEPFLLEAGQLRPADLVEDELLLALPIVPRHDYACAPDIPLSQEDGAASPPEPSPFAVLDKLRKN